MNQHQNVNSPENSSNSNGLVISVKDKKRRRAYEPSHIDITPYRKTPKMIASSYIPLDHPRRLKYEVMEKEIADSWKKDIL